jgi:hypothetical protein
VSPSAARAPGPFRRRTVLVLALLGGGALAATLLFAVFGPKPSGGDAVATAVRRSAVGYQALVQLIAAEVPVEAGRGLYPSRLSPQRPLLVLDPSPQQVEQLPGTLALAAAEGVPVVLVLPKWAADLDPVRTGWVANVSLKAAVLARTVARTAVESGLGVEEEAATDETGEEGADDDTDAGTSTRVEVVRPAATGALTWESPLLSRTAAGTAPPRPDLPQPQLLTDSGDALVPLLSFEKGILIAKVADADVYLVSDPDLVNVAGLGRGDNAVVAHRLFVDLLAPDAWVVREGSFGALPPESSVWAALFRPPLEVVTLHVAVLALLALWLATARFGRPLEAPPRVPPGKRTLVDNTARLLETAGDPGDALERYLRLTTEAAAERLGLPPGLSVDERRRRLHRIARSRGATTSLATLVADAARLPAAAVARRRRAVEVAAALHRWKEETLDGSVPHA